MTDIRTSLEDLANEYPYPDGPHANTHPSNLAALAALHGMRSPDLETCRVLELGCARGRNLVGIAQDLPRATLVGVDFSRASIEAAQELAASAAVPNVKFLHEDVTRLDLTGESFDYIIADNIYSYLSREQAPSLLELVARHLTPGGILFMRFNAYPASHAFGIIRDGLRWELHARKLTTVDAKVERALWYLAFVGVKKEITNWNMSDRDIAKAFREFVQDHATAWNEQLHGMTEQVPSLIVHDVICDHLEPYHFHEVASAAEERGLQFLCEAEAWVRELQIPADVLAAVEKVSEDRLDREQYIDFFMGPLFRQSLFCKSSGATVVGAPTGQEFHRLSFRASLEPATATAAADVPAEYSSLDGRSISLNTALEKQVVRVLSAANPRAVPFAELAQAVAGAPNIGATADIDGGIRQTLLRLHLAGELVQVHALAPEVLLDPGDHPNVRRLARLLAAESERDVPNAFHEGIMLEPYLVPILPMFDGTRTREELASLTYDAFCQYRQELMPDVPLPSKDDVFDATITLLSHAALFVPPTPAAAEGNVPEETP